jgi:hypothetical protein
MTQLSWGAAWLSARDSSPDNPGVGKKTGQILSSADAGDYLRIGFQNISVVSEAAQVILRKDVLCTAFPQSTGPISAYMHDVCMASVYRRQ